MAATFITDLGTALALSILFIKGAFFALFVLMWTAEASWRCSWR